MLLVHHSLPQLDQSDVILEGCWVVVRVNLLLLQLIVFMRILLTLLLHVPLPQPHLHLLNGMIVDTVRCCHDPVLIDQRSSTTDALRPEQPVLDQSCSPGMMTK